MEPVANRFSSYQLTTEEELRGSVLTLEQAWVIQNHLAEAALAKSALKLDPNDPLPFVQQEAYQDGKIELCEYLLSNSQAAEEALTDLRRHQPVEEQTDESI